MSDEVLGWAVIGFFAMLLVAAALLFRRRPDEVVVTVGTVRGQRGLAIHPWRGHWLTAAVACLMIALILVWGVSQIGSNNSAAGFFLIGGLLMAYVGWCRATGRAGDGTITLTPEGIHQLYAGSEVFVPWDDVRGLVTTPKDFVVETTRPVVPVQHMLPLVGGRRRSVGDAGVVLPRRNLPPLLYQDMIFLYASTPTARDELGTDEILQRVRGDLVALS